MGFAAVRIAVPDGEVGHSVLVEYPVHAIVARPFLAAEIGYDLPSRPGRLFMGGIGGEFLERFAVSPGVAVGERGVGGGAPASNCVLRQGARATSTPAEWFH